MVVRLIKMIVEYLVLSKYIIVLSIYMIVHFNMILGLLCIYQFYYKASRSTL